MNNFFGITPSSAGSGVKLKHKNGTEFFITEFDNHLLPLNEFDLKNSPNGDDLCLAQLPADLVQKPI